MTHHLKLLFWLRWKYLWRSTRGQRFGYLISLVFALVVSGILFFGVMTAMKMSFLKLVDPAPWEFVTLGFILVYLLWLYVGSFSDLYDPGRLAPYPIPPRAIFLGSTLSSFAGASMLFGIGLLAGFVAGIPGTPAQYIVRSVLFIVLIFHLQMLARLFRLVFLGLLTSRRWRDATILISTLIGGSFYIFHMLVGRGQVKGVGEMILPYAQDGAFSRWFAWLPPTWLAWAFSLDGSRAIIGLLAFCGATFVIYLAGGWAEQRLAFSEPVFYHKSRKPAAHRGVEHFLRGLARPIRALLGTEIAAVARKEIAVFLRDPTIRHRILANFFYVLIPIAAPFIARGAVPPKDTPQLMQLVSPVILFAEVGFLMNIFGTDGTAIRTMMGYPTSRRRILVGKNAAYFALFLPFNLVVLTLTTIAASRMGPEAGDLAKALPLNMGIHLASLITVMAVGNVSSVFFPLKMLAPGVRMQRQESDGCMSFVMRALAFLILSALVAPLVVAGMFLSALGPAMIYLIFPIAIVYAGTLYLIGLGVAEAALLSREEAIGDYFRAA